MIHDKIHLILPKSPAQYSLHSAVSWPKITIIHSSNGKRFGKRNANINVTFTHCGNDMSVVVDNTNDDMKVVNNANDRREFSNVYSDCRMLFLDRVEVASLPYLIQFLLK